MGDTAEGVRDEYPPEDAVARPERRMAPTARVPGQLQRAGGVQIQARVWVSLQVIRWGL